MIEKCETFSINGCIQRDGDALITQAEADEFMDRFIDLVEAHGLGFGGGYSLDPHTVEEQCAQELKEVALQLHNLVWTLEHELEQAVPWKDDAEALIRKMGFVWQDGRLVDGNQTA